MPNTISTQEAWDQRLATKEQLQPLQMA
jgi:hypothetical protein